MPTKQLVPLLFVHFEVRQFGARQRATNCLHLLFSHCVPMTAWKRATLPLSCVRMETCGVAFLSVRMATCSTTILMCTHGNVQHFHFDVDICCVYKLKR
jgi:hypothetical protein